MPHKKAAGDVGVVGVDDSGIEMLGVGVDRITEQRHLDDRARRRSWRR